MRATTTKPRALDAATAGQGTVLERALPHRAVNGSGRAGRPWLANGLYSPHILESRSFPVFPWGRSMIFRQTLTLLALAVTSSSCVVSRVEVELLNPRQALGTSVESPLKAFLTDGGIAVFPEGARIRADSVFGAGTRYSLDLASWDSVNAIAFDDLLGLQSIRADTRLGESVAANATAVFSGPFCPWGSVSSSGIALAIGPVTG